MASPHLRTARRWDAIRRGNCLVSSVDCALRFATGVCHWSNRQTRRTSWPPTRPSDSNGFDELERIPLFPWRISARLHRSNPGTRHDDRFERHRFHLRPPSPICARVLPNRPTYNEPKWRHPIHSRLALTRALEESSSYGSRPKL